jgi:hypothetical protein
MHLCQVDTFFAVGSPLGVFLALRNIRIGIGNNFSACLLYSIKKIISGLDGSPCRSSFIILLIASLALC